MQASSRRRQPNLDRAGALLSESLQVQLDHTLSADEPVATAFQAGVGKILVVELDFGSRLLQGNFFNNVR